ncbi:MAG: hypothetical protein JSV94_06360, partial [Methanobacteriota archaeon]
KAIEISRTVYSLHNKATDRFVSEMASSLGVECRPVKRYKFEIPYAFEFHRKAKGMVTVVLFKFRK